MKKNKLSVLFKLYWVKIAIIAGLSSILLILILMIYFGSKSFLGMESFSKNQLMAQMSIYLVIFMLGGVVQAFIFAFVNMYFVAGGGFAKIGQERIKTAKVNVKWNEVIGMDQVKKEAWELVELLKDRRMLKAIGGKIIKGTMLVGPPGCGKTYLAKAIATEAGLPFLSAVGSEFVGIFIGVGSQRIRTLFKEARALADIEGGCIIFIDEIDSFARPRMADKGFGGGTMDHNATINQFLTELDGLRQKENNIVVIAATNVPEEELDPAIMRAGRFDRKLYVGRPNLKERKDLFEFYLSKIKADTAINTKILSQKALWFSPSDIENMVREAAIVALRNKRETVSMKDLSESYDRVIFGLRSNVQLSEKEKIWVAYHEAGHAIISYLTHPTDDVIKATIIPHRGSLGFVAHHPAEEINIHSKEYWLATIKVCLASYAAEQIKFGTTGSGVAGDFQTAMHCAHDMVWRFGMGRSGKIGDFYAFSNSSTSSFLSEEMKTTLNNDVQEILNSCLKEVTGILSEKRELLEYFAQELIKKEELEYDEIESIFNKFDLKPLSRGKI
ncbi:MAG: AAA family ATPase [Candidatus Omnitrophota bacterium]